ncbi:MAG: galactose-1-phosphate uridylyltransferase [Candidatus Aceula meridiana]|nr:galactose-1-phosphate uridylyltransferase [Candidatus Aceula meridiana]
MSELRKDPVLGRWVIVQTDDSLSPQDYEKENRVFRQQAICPFCPEREDRTPPEIDSVRYDGSHANSPGWITRVVPNRFPALEAEGDIDRKGIGLYDISKGVGAHEVVVETPDHDKDFPDFSDKEMYEVINKYCSRSIDLARDKRFRYVMIFKNYGASAGASLEHAHSQIIALPMIPKYVLQSLEGAKQYYQDNGRCVYCDIIKQEVEDKERIVTENNDFICFASYTSRFPFETWIMPKKHQSSFCQMSDGNKHSLGKFLKEVLQRNKACLSDPSYNFFIHTAPITNSFPEGYHWHIEIIPKLTNMAGFEWGTGFYIVPTAPCLAARYLREAKI